MSLFIIFSFFQKKSKSNILTFSIFFLPVYHLKSVKNCLKKVLGLKRIDYVELETTLKEIQLILNNRPLCEPVEEEFDFLTPNNILFGRRLETINDQIPQISK